MDQLIRDQGLPMTQAKFQTKLLLPIAAAMIVAGCSGGGNGAGLTTASILDGAGPSTEGPKVAADDPLARPIQVGWTVARAQKCGFNFDPVKVRSSFLASEAQRGLAGDQLGKIEKSYDQTVTTVRANVAGDEEYCTDKRSAAIKTDLQRHLAGDFSPKLQEPAKKAASSGGWFEGWGGEPEEKKFDPKNIWKELEDKKNGTRTATQ
jgi:hypothetical protein